MESQTLRPVLRPVDLLSDRVVVLWLETLELHDDPNRHCCLLPCPPAIDASLTRTTPGPIETRPLIACWLPGGSVWHLIGTLARSFSQRFGRSSDCVTCWAGRDSGTATSRARSGARSSVPPESRRPA